MADRHNSDLQAVLDEVFTQVVTAIPEKILSTSGKSTAEL